MSAEGKLAGKDPAALSLDEPTKSGWKRWLTNRWVLAIVVGSLVVHGVGFTYARMSTSPAQAVSPEIELGKFSFLASDAPSHDITSAEFKLYVHLLNPTDLTARRRLSDNRFRLEQDIEQLLRQARGADFADPKLAEFKLQLQRQINETLGAKTVDDVIITDLSLGHRTGKVESVDQTASLPSPN